jgi:hypothetical protein
MHDDLLERRLRAALHREAGDLPLTITTPELERRLALRGRLTAGRRTAWLLAAAVGIGVLGVGAVIAGLTDDPSPSPEPTTSAVEPTGPASTGPLRLGTLDEVIAASIGNEVVLAQAHDLLDLGGTVDPQALPERVSVSLGPIAGSTDYQLTFVCEGSGPAQLQTFAEGTGAPHIGFDVDCDAKTYTQPIGDDSAFELAVHAPRDASWRVVVRRLEGGGPGTAAEPAPLGIAPAQQELVRIEDRPMEPQGRTWGDSGLFLDRIGPVGARWNYDARVSCAGSDSVRLLFGHEPAGERFAATAEMLAPCDGRLHELSLGIPQPAGSVVAVAATVGTRWSVLVVGEQPPISIADDQPGWQRQVGFGPHLSFDPTEHMFTAPGVDGGGPVLVVIACAGTSPIVVKVDVGRTAGRREEILLAECSPEGAETAQSFELPTGTVSLTLAEPVGAWTAISILVPDPLREGN